MNQGYFTAKPENPQQQKAKPIKLKQLQAEEMPKNFSAKLEIRSKKSQAIYPSDKAEKSKALTTFICQLSQSAKIYKTWQNSGNKISNGELSCAAAALLVKSVRVGVGLGDLLDTSLYG